MDHREGLEERLLEEYEDLDAETIGKEVRKIMILIYMRKIGNGEKLRLSDMQVSVRFC